ncbi:MULTISPECIES: hypothetical protein [unclassified Roseateles]|uniref:hypothetical protein n=1 Tax=unclassified Roseateles TaxID=2626991 RepID=UPI0006FFD92C|nr:MULTISPECIES: hypothetical protein [unclassified Roseateles]KQW52221.1 hypothetical protein ASC81_06430 [Pelomonas sp. Root405]
MHLTAEQHADLARFPCALRDLVHAELAAGNAIEDIGHSFPAPPVGAYVLLVRALTTRPVASGQGLDFRARNSAITSGEFTDAGRHFFVLLPPVAAPALPSMDAIRRSHAPLDQPLGAEGATQRLPAQARLGPQPSQHPSALTCPDSVEAIQQAIVHALKREARFNRSDKEGSSTLMWRTGRFVRTDEGDYPSEASCSEEADLWPLLRSFCRLALWRAEQGQPLSELDTWRVIWRSMSPP